MSVYNILYILLAFSFALSAVAMWVNWLLNRHELAVKDWAVSLSLIMVGCTLAIIARLNQPDAEAMVPLNFYSFLRDLGTSLNGLAWMLVWFGVLRFMGRDTPRITTLLSVWLVFLFVLLIGHSLQMPAAWNVAWISLLVSVVSLMVLYEVLRPGIGGVASWFACAGFSLAALTWGTRSLMSFVDISRSIDSEFDTAVMFGAVISAYCCMMGLVLLTNQRLIDRIGSLHNRDPLTKALSRPAFFSSVTELLGSDLNSQTSSVVLLDMDNFAEINDEHGHESGDLALSQVALLAMQVLGRQDLFARYSGDEFVFFLHGKSGSQTRIAMNRLQVMVQQNIVESVRGAFQVRLSMGIAELKPEDRIEDAINRASQALDMAKSSGNSRVVLNGVNLNLAQSPASKNQKVSVSQN